MLAKKNRLNLSQESSRNLWKVGRHFRGQGFNAVYDYEDQEVKMAITIPKQVAPQAAKRNELRRKIYSLLEGLINLEPGLRLIIKVSDKRLGELTSEQLREIFQPLIAEIKSGKP